MGEENPFKTNSVRRRRAEKVLAECCYGSDNFLHLEMDRDCSIIRKKYCQILQWYSTV